LFGGGTLDLGQVYRVLDHVGSLSGRLQEQSARGVARPAGAFDTVDYDVTNYFFHIDNPDVEVSGKDGPRGSASRQRGHSKENRIEPIIQMGLFCDTLGIPICFRLFDGNIPDTSTLSGVLGEFKSRFAPGRIVVVADKAMNTAPNTSLLVAGGDGWIVSASARHADAATTAWLLDQHGWDDHGTWKTKSKTITRTVTAGGVRRQVAEKLVARWSADSACRDKKVRADMVAQAVKLADDPALFKASNRRGVKKYVTSFNLDPATGQILENADTILGIDHAKVDAEAVMDGYQLIRTSETSLSDEAVIDRYHQLWRIEAGFRVSKTDLKTRPIHVWTPGHIEAHFLICYLALLITRLLEHWTGLPTSQLLDALRHLEAIDCGHDIHRISRPDTWNAIDRALGVTLNQAWAHTTQIKTWATRLNQTIHHTDYTTTPTH